MNPSSSQPASSLRARLKVATRQAILDAAEAAFAAQGIQRSRMEDIAAQAGVAVGTLYNYFADRGALVEALLATRRAELLAELDAARAAAEPSFEAHLGAFVTATLAYFTRHLGLFAVHMEAELLARSEGRTDRPTLRVVHERAARLMAEGVDAGDLRGDDVELYPALLIGMIRGLFMRQVYTGAPLPDAAGARIIRAFLRGVEKVD